MDWKDSKDCKKQVGKNKNFFVSLRHAIDGLKVVFKEERNFRYHCLLAVLVTIASFIFKLSVMEFLWVMMSIFLVILMELLNTITENIVDLITPDTYHDLAKKAKDIGAAIVLLSACFSVLVAAIVFLPKIWIWLSAFL